MRNIFYFYLDNDFLGSLHISIYINVALESTLLNYYFFLLEDNCFRMLCWFLP